MPDDHDNKPLYKVLVGGKACHGGDMAWSLPQPEGDGYAPGQWHRVEPPIVLCERGLHLTSEPSKWLVADCEIFLAEGRGECAQREDKTAFAEARLLRPAPEMLPAHFTASMAFVREQIPAVPWLQPDGAPDPAWRLFTAPTWAAARAAARAAAWAAAGDAALYTLVEHICGDVELDERHREHARARWRVWEKGYALYGDVNGTLFVYAAEEAQS